MRTIVVYKSKYGSTKDYAKWIAVCQNCGNSFKPVVSTVVKHL